MCSKMTKGHVMRLSIWQAQTMTPPPPPPPPPRSRTTFRQHWLAAAQEELHAIEDKTSRATNTRRLGWGEVGQSSGAADGNLCAIVLQYDKYANAGNGTSSLPYVEQQSGTAPSGTLAETRGAVALPKAASLGLPCIWFHRRPRM